MIRTRLITLALTIAVMVGFGVLAAQDAQARNTYDWWSQVSGRDVRGPIAKGQFTAAVAGHGNDPFGNFRGVLEAYGNFEVGTNDFGSRSQFAVSLFGSFGHMIINDTGGEFQHLVTIGAKIAPINPISPRDRFATNFFFSVGIPTIGTDPAVTPSWPYGWLALDVAIHFGSSSAYRITNEFFVSAILDFGIMAGTILGDVFLFDGRMGFSYVPDRGGFVGRFGMDFDIGDFAGDDLDFSLWFDVEYRGLFLSLMWRAVTDGFTDALLTLGFTLTFSSVE